MAEQLTPSQTASLDTSRIAGFVTVGGGATSHVAILARALGLPSLCGVAHPVLALDNGTRVLLDADNGELHVSPDQALVEQLQATRDRQRQRHQRDLEQSAQAARTLDGHRVEVSANVGSLRDVEQAISLGGEGVGLLRSELLYLDRAHPPGHDEQAALYRAVAQALGAERNLVVRTLDVGGDKPLAYVPMAHEANPFLGMRGIRLCLERPSCCASSSGPFLPVRGWRGCRSCCPWSRNWRSCAWRGRCWTKRFATWDSSRRRSWAS